MHPYTLDDGVEAAHGFVAVSRYEHSGLRRCIGVFRFSADGVPSYVQRVPYIIIYQERSCVDSRVDATAQRTGRNGFRCLTVVHVVDNGLRLSDLLLVTLLRGLLLVGLLLELLRLLELRGLLWLYHPSAINGVPLVLDGLAVLRLLIGRLLVLWLLIGRLLVLWLLILRLLILRLLAETHHHLESAVGTLDDFLFHVELVLDIKLGPAIRTLYSDYFHIFCFEL